MSWSAYGEFLAFAVMVVLVPGPDFAIVTKNTLTAGKGRGRYTAFGVCTSNAFQGTLAATGLSALVMRAQPVFEAIKWAGVCYLTFLGAQALRSAIRGRYWPPGTGDDRRRDGVCLAGWRQGFISNITNPKVLVFYIAVLPQFLHPGAAAAWLLVFAWSHALLSLLYLLALVAGLHRMRRMLSHRRVRRVMDGTTGAVLVGFGARLAAEHG